jgi:hypothetical protein
MSQQTALYDTDFFLWTQAQAAALRDGKVDAFDLANLAEEIESLGKSDRRTLASHLEGLVMHLLKWRYQPTRRQEGHSWDSTIAEHRRQIALIVDDSPSLRRARADLLARGYPHARHRASGETGLQLATFPEQCPWEVHQILADDFFPEG